jgi:hypothetical protein
MQNVDVEFTFSLKSELERGRRYESYRFCQRA